MIRGKGSQRQHLHLLNTVPSNDSFPGITTQLFLGALSAVSLTVIISVISAASFTATGTSDRPSTDFNYFAPVRVGRRGRGMRRKTRTIMGGCNHR